jgi:arsenate reductase (glutaredoxin)
MVQIIPNPRCGKSRAGMLFLEERGIKFEEIRYLENPMTKKEIITILKKLGIKPFEWVRKNEEIYKTRFKGLNMSDDEWIDALVEFPVLMERPVVIHGEKAIIGRPVELIANIL